MWVLWWGAGRRGADEWVFYFVLFWAYCSLFLLQKPYKFVEKQDTKTRKRVLSSWPPKDIVNNLQCIFPDFYFSKCLTVFFSKMNKYCAQFCNRGCLGKATLYTCGIYFQQAEMKNRNIYNPTANLLGWGFKKKSLTFCLGFVSTSCVWEPHSEPKPGAVMTFVFFIMQQADWGTEKIAAC